MRTTTQQWNDMRLGQLERRMRIGPRCFTSACSLCVAVVAQSLAGCHRDAQPPSTAVIIDFAAIQRFEIQLDGRPLDGQSCRLTKGVMFRLAGRFECSDQTFVAGGTTREGLGGFIPLDANPSGAYLSVMCLFRQSDSGKAGYSVPIVSPQAVEVLRDGKTVEFAAPTQAPLKPGKYEMCLAMYGETPSEIPGTPPVQSPLKYLWRTIATVE